MISQMTTATIKERPVIFSGPMIRSILDGKKSQTRRVMKPRPFAVYRLTDADILCYRTEHEDKDRHPLEANPCIPELGLHGGGGWSDLLADALRGLWTKGARGLVSVTGPRWEERLPDRVALPSEPQGDDARPPARVHGLSRATSDEIPSDSTSGRQLFTQRSGESSVGYSGRKLDGPEGSRKNWRQFHLQADDRGTGASAVDIEAGIVQPKARRTNSRDEAVFRLTPCPFIVGQVLWIRETWRDGSDGIEYRANDVDPNLLKWRPSIFMPRIASRITLEVTGVRVQRLQEITNDDALAEGVDVSAYHANGAEAIRKTSGILAYMDVWESINGGRGFGWSTNPWIWVVEFKRVL